MLFSDSEAQRFAYDAYGNMLTGTGLTLAADAWTSLLYSGEQTDKTGLQYLRARYYDPTNGRFSSFDPFAGDTEDPASLHKYLYVAGDPINGIDPTGLVEFSLVGIQVSISIQSFVYTTLISFGIGKGISAVTLLLTEGNLQNFKLFETLDLLSLIPGGVIVGATTRFVRLPLQLVARTAAGKVLGKFAAQAAGKAGGAAGDAARRVGNVFGQMFASSGGMQLTTSTGAKVVLAAGNKARGFVHVLRRHLIPYWDGSKIANTTFWPSSTTSSQLLDFLQEAVSISGNLVPNAANYVRLSNGIRANLVVDGVGNVITFYPVSGPGVVFAKELVKAVP